MLFDDLFLGFVIERRRATSVLYALCSELDNLGNNTSRLFFVLYDSSALWIVDSKKEKKSSCKTIIKLTF